jgi:hypothetical protein
VHRRIDAANCPRVQNSQIGCIAHQQALADCVGSWSTFHGDQIGALHTWHAKVLIKHVQLLTYHVAMVFLSAFAQCSLLSGHGSNQHQCWRMCAVPQWHVRLKLQGLYRPVVPGELATVAAASDIQHIVIFVTLRRQLFTMSGDNMMMLARQAARRHTHMLSRQMHLVVPAKPG